MKPGKKILRYALSTLIYVVSGIVLFSDKIDFRLFVKASIFLALIILAGLH